MSIARRTVIKSAVWAAPVVVAAGAAPALAASVVTEPGTLTKTLTVLPTAGNDTLLDIGPRRAWGHARESLDLALAAGAELQVRIVNGTKPVTVTLIGTNSDFDESGAHRLVVPSDGSWATITAQTEVGVFANVQGPDDWAEPPQLEYRVVSGESGPMPEYRHGGDAAAFIEEWKTGGSPFAVIADEAITFAIHKDDLIRVESIQQGGKPVTVPGGTTFDSEFTSLDELIETYRTIIATYDRWLGLDGSAPQHVAPPMAYFVRPDTTSPGFAYFRSSFQNWQGWQPGYMGGTMRRTTIDAYLNGLTHTRTFAMLHELAHGYDGQMTQSWYDDDLFVSEAWNNIYVHYYQEDVIANGRTWVYWRDRTERQEYYDALRAAAGPNVWGSFVNNREDGAQLDFLIRMIDLTGLEGFTRFNQQLRDEAAAGNDPYWCSRTDLVLQHLGEASGYNFLAWLDAFSLQPSDEMRARLMASKTSMALPLSDLVPDKAAQAPIVQRLGLASAHALVTPDMLKASGLTSSFRVEVANPAGGVVELRDKGVVVAQATVVDGFAQFTNVPVGVYRLDVAGAPVSWVGASVGTEATRVLASV